MAADPNNLINNIKKALLVHEWEKAHKQYNKLKKYYEETLDEEKIFDTIEDLFKLGLQDWAAEILKIFARAEKDGKRQGIEYQLELVDYYVQADEIDTAQELLLEIPDINSNPQALVLAAEIYLKLDFLDVSLEKLSQAEQLDPDNLRYTNAMMQIYMQLERFSEANHCIEKLLTAYEDNSNILEQFEIDYLNLKINQGICFISMGRNQEGMALLEEMGPGHLDPFGLAYLAAAYAELGNFERARGILKKPYEDGYLPSEYLDTYAYYCEQVGDFDAAKRVYHEKFLQDPFDTSPLFIEAIENMVEDDPKALLKATDLVNKILEIDPESVDGRYLLARINMLSGELDKAKEMIEQIIEEGYEETEIYYTAALIFWKLEEDIQARKYFAHVFEDLIGDDTFAYDYLSFLREIGDRQTMLKVFTKEPIYRQLEPFAGFYEELMEES